MKATFDYDGKNDIGRMGGYLQALTQVYRYIADETKFNPDKRFIDSVPLLDKIAETNAEIGQIFDEAEKDLLDEADKILNEAHANTNNLS